MGNLDFQQFSFPQSGVLAPQTIASAATITPQTGLIIVTGTVQIATITPFVDTAHMLVIIFTDATPGILLTSGNITTAVEPTQNIPVILFYNPLNREYYGGELKLT